VVQSNAAKTNPEDRVKLHVKDGVHLDELGQLTMAYAILKGLGAPEEVSSAVVDAKTGKVATVAGCEISEVEADESGVSFTRLDRGLPLNLGPLSPLNYQWVPLPDGINRYLLKVEGLADGDYTLTAEGRALGKQSAAELAKGVNLSSMTADGWQPGGPWDAQSCVVKELVDARDKLESGRALQSRLLSNRPGIEALTKDDLKLESELMSEQRQVAKPYPYHFEIRKAVGK
jgi:hypothetical protein